MPQAFQLAHMDTLPSGEYRYHYRLVGPPIRGIEYSTVFLDITSPRTKRPPTITGTSGRFLFDGMTLNPDPEVPYGHPPLFVGTPVGPWMASVWRQGFVAWLASRYSDGRHAGVAAGKELSGFELRSIAIPALRMYRVLPYRHLPSAAAAEADAPPPAPDTNIVVSATLAPGWMPEDVTAAYLAMQVAAACEAHLLAACAPYHVRVDALTRAEARADGEGDASYGTALRELREHLHADTVSDAIAREALRNALDALDQRPPSLRRRSRGLPIKLKDRAATSATILVNPTRRMQAA